MVLLPFREPLPADYFADGQKVFVRGKGRVEKQRDSLIDILNYVRAYLDFDGYQVDPLDDEKFSSIAEAFAVADENEPDGREIQFLVADGDFTDNIDFGSDHPIVIRSVNYRGAKISGDLTFGATGTKLQRRIQNCEISGTLNVKDGCDLQIDNCYGDSHELNLDPSGGSVGWEVVYRNCDNNAQKVIETASSSGTRKVYFKGGSVTFTGSSPVSIYDTDIYFESLSNGAWWHTGTDSIFDLNNNGASIFFNNVVSPIVSNSTSDMFTNSANATVEFLNTNFYSSSGASIRIGGTFNTVRGFLKHWDLYQPTTAPVGTVWEDATNFTLKIWTGSVWNDMGA